MTNPQVDSTPENSCQSCSRQNCKGNCFFRSCKRWFLDVSVQAIHAQGL